MERRASCWMCRVCMRWVGVPRRGWRRESARPTPRLRRSSSRKHRASAPLAIQDKTKSAEAEQGQGAADPYVRSCIPADVDLGASRRNRDGEQAIVAAWALGDDHTVAANRPRWIVHETKDGVAGGRSIEDDQVPFG